MSTDDTKPPLSVVPVDPAARLDAMRQRMFDDEMAALDVKYADQLNGVPQEEADRKKAATCIARAALAGYELVQLADGSFIASKWGMFRSLENAAAVEAFLARVGAPA